MISKDFDGAPEWISKRLFMSVTPAQAAKSIDLLERLGFIKQTKKGTPKLGPQHPTTIYLQTKPHLIRMPFLLKGGLIP